MNLIGKIKTNENSKKLIRKKMQTFNIWIRGSIEEGIIWSLDPRSLSWRWGFWPITTSFYRFACFIMKTKREEEEERVKKLRRRRIETKGFVFSLSILCVFVSSSEERLTIFEHFYHVTRADFLFFFFVLNG